jgi:beta-galactosidase
MRRVQFLLVSFFCLQAIFRADAAARENALLDVGWKFQSGELSNAAAINFDDTGWQNISLPHCWGWEQAQVTNKYYRGPGWYRRDLELSPEKGKRYFLRFEAASLVANVFLNGQKLGEHRGGFGAFCYEITGALAAGGKNVLAVRVSNARELDIAPLEGDFCVFGGLYRPAHLLTTADVCFTPLDHASPGVFWQQTQVSKSEAKIDFTAEISNGTKTNANRVLVIKILDAAGKVISSTSRVITIPARITPPFHLQLSLHRPHLWNGRADPYLYRAVAELRATNGVVCDSVEQPLGLRSYRIDPDKGFFLNDKPYRLLGVCRHQDVWNKGWALSHAEHERDVQLICEMGANAVRCAHYQHSDDFYSLCDQAGLLVWAEIPQVNDVRTTTEFFVTSRNQLLDLIRQNENHPSIFCWSLFNEIGNGHTEDPHRLLQDLNILAHGEDPSRPTIAATCISTLPQMNAIPDLLGWNKYPGWYSGRPEDCGPMLDSLRYTSQHGGFCVSEYGAGANPFQHELPPRKPAKTTGPWHPEEWQCAVHEADWAAIKARPFVWGSFAWNMFDFVVAGRNEGGVPSRNDKGLVTSDRQLKKDVFYFYEANWSAQPVLHLTSQRFTERTNAVTDVKVYSNAKNVELFLNGRSLGKMSNGRNCVFVWQNVSLVPGENRVEAKAAAHNKELHDECVWNRIVN